MANELVSLADARPSWSGKTVGGTNAPSTGVPSPARPAGISGYPGETAGGSFIAWSTPCREYSYSSATWLEPAGRPGRGFRRARACRAAVPAPVARTRR